MASALVQQRNRQFNWKYFPRILIGIMLLVMAVNVRFITLAVATFPGTASSDDFDTSNRYNAVLDADARQSALGWTERASATHGIAALDLSGPAGAPLAGAVLQVHAARPLGTDQPIPLAFHEATPGHFVAASALPLPGQWDLQCRIKSGDHVALVTRRIVVQ